jgi:uncharacterized phage protein (TIGR02218 family)
MTRTASGALDGKLDDTTMTLARIWSITRPDATVIYLTDADQDLVVDANTYIAAQGFTVSSIMVAAGDPIQGMEISMPANTNGISGADVDAGLYDGSICEMKFVDYNAPTGGTMTVFGGVVGQTNHDRERDSIILSVTGLFGRNKVMNIENWSSTCRADLGDSRCTVDIDALKTNGTVTAIDSQFTFEDTSLTLADDDVALGLVHWLTGNNAGLAMEVKGNVSATDKITMFTPAPFVIQVGDTYDVYPGCDKSLSTCRDTYNNVINFQGEPFIPNGKMQF